ncbi:MAG: TPM domain-containing protein [Deltaproteobacteria bacterium]|nr:TPM domain-containing protein [Deltaproteobacteria bacterium]
MVRSKNPFLFFSKKEKEEIIRAIGLAEKQTSGEIRIHLEKKKTGDVEARAREIFEKIGMTQTEAKNGVLIYLNTRTHSFVLLGDSGIDAKVGNGFWEETVARILESFKADRMADGIVGAVKEIGEKLKTHFPYQRTDLNELPDEISYS